MEKHVDPQVLARFKATLRQLPERQRALFVALVEDHPPSYTELGKRLGISVAEVEQAFAGALAALADAIDG